MDSSERTPRIVVIDTNVVLDLWVFCNTECITLAAALLAGELCWIATAPMRDELAHVLKRGHLDNWEPDQDKLWSQWDHLCTEVSVPAPPSPVGGLRCSDPDDQKFVDLAVAGHARWLLSRDRAILKLARRLSARGVEAVAPDRWSPLR